MFPFVHIPATMTASGLCEAKPFLWLVIMALTDKSASDQFGMEDTIWHIISQRVIREQWAGMDVLLGIICFNSWSGPAEAWLLPLILLTRLIGLIASKGTGLS